MATYPYTDAEGTILYDIRRWRGGVAKYSARSFDKNGRPRKGMPAPARRVLYRLPEVLAAETVYVDEGEKDADSVAQALSGAAVGSAAATSAPFGAANTNGRAKAVWLPQFIETLRDKHVKIIVDRDRAGYAHGLHVYDAQVGVSASVELLEPAEGNDATDHLTAGRTLAEFVSVTRAELEERLAELEATDTAGEAVTDTAGEAVTDTVGTADTDTAAAADTDTATGGNVTPALFGVRSAVTDTAAEGDTPGTVIDFPRRSPKAADDARGVPVFEVRGRRLYEVRWKRDEAGEWAEDLWQVLGCDVEMVAQVLGGLIGEEKADKAAQARLERVELVARHPSTDEELFLTVTAKEWRSGDWLEALWPDVEYAATREGRAKVTQAVKATSLRCERLAEHEATGWRDLPGIGRAFIHAGGAITAKGLVPVPTSFIGPMAHYHLPAPPTTPAELKAAAEHSVGLVTDPELAPRVGLVLAGAAYRAVLGVRSQFVPAFVGNPMSGKSALAIVAAQHFGGSRLHREMTHTIQMDPTHGSSEKFGIQYLNRSADIVVIYDDFAPDNGPAQAAKRMGTFIRAAFNRSGRNKLSRESKMLEGPEPRGIPLVTAELLPSVWSARSRMLNVPSQWAEINLPAVQRLQAPAAADARSAFLAALIQWVAGRDEAELAEEVRSVKAAAERALKREGFMTRTADHVSNVYVGWTFAVRVLVDGGVWTEAEAETFLASQVWPACVDAAQADTDADDERDMGKLFLRLIGEAMTAQEAHIATDDGEVPAGLTPTACGWRPGMGEDVFLPSGVRVGYVRTHPRTGETRLLLLPKVAAPLAEKFATQAGLELGLTVAGISEVLDNAGVGLATGTESGKIQRQARRRIAGRLERVWDLPLSAVWGEGEETPDDTDEGPGSGPAGPGSAGPGEGPTDDGSSPAAPGGVVAKLDELAPCAGCGELASASLDGVPLHLGACEPPAAALPSAGEPAQEELTYEAETPAPAEESTPAPAAPAPRPAPARTPAGSSRRRARGEALEIEAEEIAEAVKWSRALGADDLAELTEEQAADVVRRFHEVTGCRYHGPHGTISALLSGHTKWPGAKAPKVSDLGLFEELRRTDAFWKARSWIVTPGDPAADSRIQAADVNAQYVASSSSVELGEGDPLHYEPGDELPANVFKLPGWVRLGADVDGAPHGLELPADMWIPTPLAVYLERDKGVQLDVVEALVWPEHRRALSNLAGHFRDWSKELKADETPAGVWALRMVKTLYTKALGGYLASTQGLTPPEWHRPDWAALLRAQAEANMLRALDRLPAGAVVRAKYADAAFIELSAGVDLAEWHRVTAKGEREPYLDDVQPGRWKLVGAALPADPSFRGLRSTAESWRAAYEAGQAEEVSA
ncbi:hypothetical protein [Pseudoxanthomonas sp. UTMC 1351]|uniref:hypothetical protein n=1 Tax=Pseudoxanthomonas sp. UTMC 1351 TaxID=2695853 RepID=UPI0034CEF6BF